jgi:hypothetical protein
MEQSSCFQATTTEQRYNARVGVRGTVRWNEGVEWGGDREEDDGKDKHVPCFQIVDFSFVHTILKTVDIACSL